MFAFKNRLKGAVSMSVAGVCVGILLTTGFFLYAPWLHAVVSSICASKYPLTNNRLDCGEYQSSSDSLNALDTTLDAAVAQYVQEGKAKKISIWVRDLTTNQWASTNENQLYAPASLLKLPVLITYYKLAEIEPSILDSPITYQEGSAPSDSAQNFPSQANLTLGQQYRVNQLLQAMMVNSDNNASDDLITHINPNSLEQVFIDLGVKVSTQAGEYDFVTVKSYASMLRNLYNASYLNRYYSEKALELMSSSTFKGITTPLPPSVVVAHKFGERKVLNSDGSVQATELHDCGIVYKTPDPYVVCIMTSGNNFDDLLSVIENLSRITYYNL